MYDMSAISTTLKHVKWHPDHCHNNIIAIVETVIAHNDVWSGIDLSWPLGANVFFSDVSTKNYYLESFVNIF